MLWFYLRPSLWNKIRAHISRLPYRARQISKWLLATLVGTFAVAYIQLYFVSIKACQKPGEGVSICIINKTKYGGAIGASDPDTYTRSCRLGSISRNDIAVVDIDSAHLALRITAIAGDTIQMSNGCALINGHYEHAPLAAKCVFSIAKYLPQKTRHSMERAAGAPIDSAGRILLPLNQRIAQWQHQTHTPLIKGKPDARIYPYNHTLPWNAYHTGKIYLPRKGDTIRLTPYNIALYSPLIERYEDADFGAKLAQTDSITEYTFKLSYYWALSDNRDICTDSRALGPIPESRIEGNIIAMYPKP